MYQQFMQIVGSGLEGSLFSEEDTACAGCQIAHSIATKQLAFR